jgi:hypothetical protein
MRPVDCFAAIGDLLTKTVGSPYREKEMSSEEWDNFTDQVLLLAGQQKGASDAGRKQNECSDAGKAR